MSYEAPFAAVADCFNLDGKERFKRISLELNVSIDPKAGPADVRVTQCTWDHFCMFFYIVLRILYIIKLSHYHITCAI
jgi:hypothetical protein